VAGGPARVGRGRPPPDSAAEVIWTDLLNLY